MFINVYHQIYWSTCMCFIYYIYNDKMWLLIDTSSTLFLIFCIITIFHNQLETLSNTSNHFSGCRLKKTERGYCTKCEDNVPTVTGVIVTLKVKVKNTKKDVKLFTTDIQKSFKIDTKNINATDLEDKLTEKWDTKVMGIISDDKLVRYLYVKYAVYLDSLCAMSHIESLS